MKEIVLGGLLLVSAVLLFAGAVLEWGKLSTILSGLLFVGVALVWIASNGYSRS